MWVAYLFGECIEIFMNLVLILYSNNLQLFWEREREREREMCVCSIWLKCVCQLRVVIDPYPLLSLSIHPYFSFKAIICIVPCNPYLNIFTYCWALHLEMIPSIAALHNGNTQTWPAHTAQATLTKKLDLPPPPPPSRQIPLKNCFNGTAHRCGNSK